MLRFSRNNFTEISETTVSTYWILFA